MATGRSIKAKDTAKGRRVKPSRDAQESLRDTQSAIKPKSGGRDEDQGPSLEACHPTGRQGAKRQFISPYSSNYIITNELLSIISTIGDANLAEGTKKTLAEYLAHWATWTIFTGHPAIPATPDSLAWYLAVCAEVGYSVTGLSQRVSAISYYHRLLKLPDPVNQMVRDVLRGIGRLHGDTVKQARGLTRKEFEAIKASDAAPIGKETELDARQRALKTVALISLMRDCLLRGIEASELIWGDISRSPDGTGRLLIRKSKTDRYGRGQLMPVSAETMGYLSVLRDGTEDADTVFGCSTDMIGYRIKQAAERAGLGGGFSAHSPRRGMAQALTRSGIGLEELMEAGRWESPAMALHYAREDDPVESPVARFNAKMEL